MIKKTAPVAFSSFIHFSDHGNLANNTESQGQNWLGGVIGFICLFHSELWQTNKALNSFKIKWDHNRKQIKKTLLTSMKGIKKTTPEQNRALSKGLTYHQNTAAILYCRFRYNIQFIFPFQIFKVSTLSSIHRVWKEVYTFTLYCLWVHKNESGFHQYYFYFIWLNYFNSILQFYNITDWEIKNDAVCSMLTFFHFQVQFCFCMKSSCLFYFLFVFAFL